MCTSIMIIDPIYIICTLIIMIYPIRTLVIIMMGRQHSSIFSHCIMYTQSVVVVQIPIGTYSRFHNYDHVNHDDGTDLNHHSGE